jgi:transcriptional regulator with XRE-family HTH domain
LETLRHIREQAGLSQPELSEISGVAQGTISDIELGKRKPRGRTLRKLAQALGVQVTDLLGENESLKAQAPLPDFEVERRGATDVAMDAARRQAEQDRQAAARAFESERPQPYFMRHENEAVMRLLEYPSDELAGALVEIARRVVELEDLLKRSIEAATIPGGNARKERDRIAAYEAFMREFLPKGSNTKASVND